MGVGAVHRTGQLASGWLGEHTASIDWCEDNYAVSRLVAEFWNTASNIPFILFGIHGIACTQGLPNRARYALLYLGLCVIGAGSFVFHATLKWHAQVMLDELPMVFAASQSLYIIAISVQPPTRTESSRIMLKIGIAVLPIVISALYLAYPNPLLHQVCYASIMIASTVLFQRAYDSPQLTPDIIRQAKVLNYTGTLTFLLGFAIWNIDNIYCDELTLWRNSVSDKFSWISQGHAWWHLLTGAGSARLVVGLIYLTLSMRSPGKYEVVNAFGGLLPYVRPIPEKSSNGYGAPTLNSKKTL